MTHLTFKLNYAEKKWQDYLTEMLGEEIAAQCKVEANATARMVSAKVNLIDFKSDTNVIKAVTNDKNVISAYIVCDNKIKKVLV
jgi:hypothetical protein